MNYRFFSCRVLPNDGNKFGYFSPLIHNCTARMSTPETVNVEIYADIICPWCYTGKNGWMRPLRHEACYAQIYLAGFFTTRHARAGGQPGLYNKFGSAAAGRLPPLDSGIAFYFIKTPAHQIADRHHVICQENAETLARRSPRLFH